MDALAHLFTEAIFWAQHPRYMSALAALVRLQARFRGRTDRKTVELARAVVRDQHCTLEYAVVTCLNGIVIVERKVPVHHDIRAFVDGVKECLRIDGIPAAIVSRYVTEDTIQVDGGVPLSGACAALYGGSVCRVVPRGKVGITALCRCPPQWTVQLTSGQKIQVHSQPAATVDETVALLLRQLRNAGLSVDPTAIKPRVVSSDGFYTEIHSCAALNNSTLALLGKHEFGDCKRGLRTHPDEGVEVFATMFETRLHPYTLKQMRDTHVGDAWLMPPPKRCRR